MEEEIDFHADAEPVSASDSELREVSKLAQRMLDLQSGIEALEAELKDRKEQLRMVQEVLLPEAMDAIGMENFEITGGKKVTVRSLVNASIYKDKRAEAYDWLREHGHDGIIRTSVALHFTKGQSKEADKVLGELQDHGYTPEREDNVHPGTLNSWAKEMVQKGDDLPANLFSLFVGRKAVVK